MTHAARGPLVVGVALGLLFSACPLASRARAAQAPDTSSSAPKGSITGKVVGDGGAPLRNATVTSYIVDGYADPQNVEVDEDGAFTLVGLNPAVYNVYARAPGYVAVSDPQKTTYHVGDSANFRMAKGGVITGHVLDAAGKPVVGLSVEAYSVRDDDGDARRSSFATDSSSTDDLGEYRIFGLEAATYVVRAGGERPNGMTPSAFASNAPTYYPGAATRAKASEVEVRLGEEVTGIDIRYRDETGRTIGGNVIGVDAKGSAWVSVELLAASDASLVASTIAPASAGQSKFKLGGLPDGEYDLIAAFMQKGVSAQSAPKHVVVHGADVNGVQLTFVPLATVAGSIVLDAPPDPDPCPETPRRTAREVLVSLNPSDPLDSAPRAVYGSARRKTGVGADATFRASGVIAGQYRVAVDLPDARWYVKSIVVGASKTDVTTTGLKVGTSAHVDGVVVTIGRGAASLAGRVATASPGAVVAPRTVVVLVPDDPEHIDDVSRYLEIDVDSSGAFAVAHVPPGKYRAFARVREPRGEDEDTRFAWEAAERKKLVALGSKGFMLELKACSTTNDAVVPFATAKGSKP